MKRSSTIFLQVVIVLIGIGALALLLWEPHVEGVKRTPRSLRCISDPFLAYVYIASIPFFVALYQAFKVLGYAGQNKIFSQAAVKALRTIKYCATSHHWFCCGKRNFHYCVATEMTGRRGFHAHPRYLPFDRRRHRGGDV